MNVHAISSSIAGVLTLCLFAAWLRDRLALIRLRADLTVAAQTEQTQTTLLSERASLDSQKDEFVANVSHELRTPLTSIRGALGLLSAGLSGQVDTKTQNLLRIAVSNTDRLIRLTNDLLDLQRIDSGRIALNIRRCSLRDLVQQGIDTMNAQADAALVLVHMILADPAHPDSAFFDGDADGVLQVITNLLSNAIKFSPPGSVVRVHLSSRAESVMLRVEDQGRGIPANELESIFQRFHQVENSDSRQKGGTGLGLAISRTIVQQHSGTIWAQANESGQGASFFVELPRNARASDAQALLPSITSRQLAGTLVVCDDDESVRQVVAEQMRRQGFSVIETDRGERAVELARTQKVDAILLDLNMPGMSGWETLRYLRSSPATEKVPVVILSVLPQRKVVPESQSNTGLPLARAQGWVQKPFHEDLLRAVVWKVLHASASDAPIFVIEEKLDPTLHMQTNAKPPSSASATRA